MSRPYYVNGIVYSKTSPHLGRGTIKTIEQYAPKIVTVVWDGAFHARNKMTTAERELWQSLPGQTQRKIMLEVL